jgi:hypothetical protein
MSWMKPLMLLVAASALPACGPFPCENSNSPEFSPPTLVRGTGRALVTCATQGQRSLQLVNQNTQYEYITYLPAGSPVYALLTFDLPQQQDGTRLSVKLEIPSTLADGTYPVTRGGPIDLFVNVSRPEEYQGTVTFQRTRDVPFADQQEPEPGTYTHGIDVTLELEGRLGYVGTNCDSPATFKVEPLTVHMERTTHVGMCENKLSDLRLGGH